MTSFHTHGDGTQNTGGGWYSGGDFGITWNLSVLLVVLCFFLLLLPASSEWTCHVERVDEERSGWFGLLWSGWTLLTLLRFFNDYQTLPFMGKTDRSENEQIKEQMLLQRLIDRVALKLKSLYPFLMANDYNSIICHNFGLNAGCSWVPKNNRSGCSMRASLPLPSSFTTRHTVWIIYFNHWIRLFAINFQSSYSTTATEFNPWCCMVKGLRSK